MEPFDEVVARHGARVLRVCRAVLSGSGCPVGPDAAEDAWSETFLAALRAYPHLPPDADVQAWLVTIARRKAVDQVRAALRTARPVADVPEPAVDVPPDLPAHLWDALEALPGKQRRCVTYHHLDGLPYAEVAALVGGTPAAARRAAADGMATLRAIARAPRNDASQEEGR